MNSEQESQLVARALDDFFQAMELRTERNVRVAKRVTGMLRIGVISAAMFAALLTGMIWAFTDRVREMTGVLGTMHTEFVRMSDNLSEMRRVISAMERDMASFTVVTGEMRLMRTTIAGMNADMATIAGRMAAMDGDVSLITGNVAGMNQSFRLLAPAVAGIGAHVEKGAAPVRGFNNLFPFSWMSR
jgi:phage-related protein